MQKKPNEQTPEKSAQGGGTDTRKPFVAPKLRREAELTKLTAERFSIFRSES